MLCYYELGVLIMDLKKEIQELQEKLKQMLQTKNNLNYEEFSEISKKLDHLIYKFHSTHEQGH